MYLGVTSSFFSDLIHAFFISNTFVRNTRLKMDKSLANFKQNPEAQFLVLVIKQQEFSLKSLP